MPVYMLEDCKTRAFEGYVIADSIEQARKQTRYSVSFYANAFTEKDVEDEAQRRLLSGVEIKGVRVAPVAPNYMALNILLRCFERDEAPTDGLECRLGGRSGVTFSSGEEVAKAIADLDDYYCLIRQCAEALKKERPILFPEDSKHWQRRECRKI